MKNITEEKLFEYGMWWRIGYGVLRIIFGLVILKVVGMPLTEVVNTLMSHELTEDPNDMLYAFVSQLLAGHQIYITYFLSLYFIFWGILDVTLSHQLIKHRLWAFPVSFILIGLFVAYEAVRFVHTHSLVLLCVMIIDTGILWLIWLEYKKLRPAKLAAELS